MIRCCSNPTCQNEITACFGTAKAGDIIECEAGLQAETIFENSAPSVLPRQFSISTGQPKKIVFTTSLKLAGNNNVEHSC